MAGGRRPHESHGGQGPKGSRVPPAQPTSPAAVQPSGSPSLPKPLTPLRKAVTTLNYFLPDKTCSPPPSLQSSVSYPYPCLSRSPPCPPSSLLRPSPVPSKVLSGPPNSSTSLVIPNGFLFALIRFAPAPTTTHHEQRRQDGGRNGRAEDE